ncbi:MAG: agmatine deiminase family protein [Bacteroidales bacterium]|nr:agmatine deiminase family protein [Bacteroidales bacterium]
MINDNQTNVVYLAEGIRHYMPLAKNLLEALYQEHIDTHFICHTDSIKHVWARDYMPIQLDEKRFLQYKYDPDYLKKAQDYIPPYETICRGLHLKCKKTDLVIDGGNVVKCGNRIIMTDKVLKENPAYTEQQLIKRLENEFECEVCLIPWDRYEFYGHSDGMVRFIDGDDVLLNNYVDIDRSLRDRILRKFHAHGFNVEELHYDLPRPSKQSWAYLNFLQVSNHIFVPGLGIREDALALEQIQAHYPNHKVIRIPDCQNLVRDGGALNCISWTIKSNVAPHYSEATNRFLASR